MRPVAVPQRADRAPGKSAILGGWEEVDMPVHCRWAGGQRPGVSQEPNDGVGRPARGNTSVVGTDAPSDSKPIAGRYILDHIIGAGATAIVHEGRDLVTDQPVAVKVYRPDGSARHRLQQRREIAALTRLRHPGLVTLHAGGTEPGPDGRTYLVTDLVGGPSLAERLLDGPLDVHAIR